MTGSGEWQFVLFALACGFSEVASGLVGTVPMLAGAILQLLTPWGVRRAGSLRTWVWVCAAIQSLMLLALSIAAFWGGLGITALYFLVAGYWASGYMTGPPWTAWLTSLVPDQVRATFWVNRSRWIQGSLAVGLCAGLILQLGEYWNVPLIAFGVVFAIAALARALSTWCLSQQSEPEPELLNDLRTPSLATMKEHFSDRRTRGLLLYMLAFFMSVFVAAPFFGPYLREQLQFEYWQIFAISGTTFVSKIILMPLVGKIARRYGPARVLWIGAILLVPAAALWSVSSSFWWLLVLQFYVGFGWACWENGSFLLVFDFIPADRRTPVMTIYQLGQAIVMVCGSLLGAALLKGVGVGPAGYVALFLATSCMRFVALFLLASLEPSGLKLRHRARHLGLRTLGVLPWGPVPEPGSGATRKLDPEDET